MDHCLAEKTITIKNCTIHYWISDNPSHSWVFLLHGAGTDHRMLDGQLPAIPPQCRLLPDIRVHGASRPMGEPFWVRTANMDRPEEVNRLNSGFLNHIFA
jgi:pimeloyl-ACP methyl ester carboxylesterase